MKLALVAFGLLTVPASAQQARPRSVAPPAMQRVAPALGELGISGVAPAIANAVYNATGVRVRDYPLTLDKHLTRLPALT